MFAESDYQLIHPENRRYYIPGPSGRWSSAFDGRFKLIHIPRPGGDILELYDLASDPGETRNLEGAGADPEVHRRLQQELQRFVDYDAGAVGAPRTIDEEVRAILDRTHDRVRGILTTKKAVLIAAAQELKRTETLEGERLRRALAGESVMEGPR